ncbi:MAG: class II aldolase/adducin family protein [Armatimonadetes bacterium]|nr:class II aldolase/adducin family protein [Armatimonadota bacterium]
MGKEEILQQLVSMSNRLGEEWRELVILGEGNTSARICDQTFFVKASGTNLRTITAEGFVEVKFEPVLEMLESRELSDDEIKERLAAAKVNRNYKLAPSVETVFHAYLLSIPGVNFVGHTHPVSVNGILCSKNWREVLQGRLFPDEIVCCGIAPVFIPYTDPGVALARKIREVVQEYVSRIGERPKAILMQNHGLIALGTTPKEVESVTMMWDKTAKILARTYHFGGPSYLTPEQVNRLATRPDEEQRKRLIKGLPLTTEEN